VDPVCGRGGLEEYGGDPGLVRVGPGFGGTTVAAGGERHAERGRQKIYRESFHCPCKVESRLNAEMSSPLVLRRAGLPLLRFFGTF
jgi:hypothetical protein